MRILCFGDSNTWGYRPVTGGRYTENERWTARLQKLSGHEILEEGENGRTTICYDRNDVYGNGLEAAAPCIRRHGKVDWIVVMLGTNDTKTRYGASAETIVAGLESVIEQLRAQCEKMGFCPRILLIGPPELKYVPQDVEFGPESVKKMRKYQHLCGQMAARLSCEFFCASHVVHGIGADGVHLTAEGHAALADILAEFFLDFKWKNR